MGTLSIPVPTWMTPNMMSAYCFSWQRFPNEAPPPIPLKLHCLEGSFLTYLTGVSVTALGLTFPAC